MTNLTQSSSSLLYQPKSVLIVDDNKELRNIAAESVEGFFATVEVHANPIKAMERLHQVEFDVLLTDIAMPELSGLELLHALQRLNTLTVPIVMTAYGNKENILRAYMLGAYDFLEKPFDPLSLRQRSRNALARARTNRIQIEMMQAMHQHLASPLKVNLRSLDEEKRLELWQSSLNVFKMRCLNQSFEAEDGIHALGALK